jgi:hypothetical protein
MRTQDISSVGEQVELVLAETREKLKAIAVGESCVAQATATVASSGHQYSDEAKLRSEWRNIVLNSDEDDYKDVRSDPEGAYLEWLRDRLTKPFEVPGYAFNKTVRRFGAEFANDVLRQYWPIEIAWAKRLRRSSDPATAVLASMFVRAAVRETGAEFVVFADALKIAYEDASYMEAQELRYSENEIRFGYGSNTFRPAFLRLYEARMALIMQKRSEAELLAMMRAARSAEEQELKILAARRAVSAVEKSSLLYSPSVLQAAGEMQVDADELVRLQAGFVERLRDGRVVIPATAGWPQSEFIDFIRTFDRSEPVPEVEKKSIHNAAMHPAHWIAALPKSFSSLDAGNVEAYRTWMETITSRKDYAPLDPVAHYGMFLVRRIYHAGMPSTKPKRRRLEVQDQKPGAFEGASDPSATSSISEIS